MLSFHSNSFKARQDIKSGASDRLACKPDHRIETQHLHLQVLVYAAVAHFTKQQAPALDLTSGAKMPLLPTSNDDFASSLYGRMHGVDQLLTDTWSDPRKPAAMPVPVHLTPTHRAPYVLCPTPIRGSSLDASLPPPYTPLPLALDRPTAPVGGLSSCSPHYRREHAVIPLNSGPVLIPSLASCGDAGGVNTYRAGWRPPQLDVASLQWEGRAEGREGRAAWGRVGAGQGVPGTPKTAGVTSHMRWASLPCALPSVQPMTAGIEVLHMQRSQPRLQHQEDSPTRTRTSDQQIDPDGQAGPSAGHSAAAAMRIRAPSFNDPRDRFHAWSFASHPQRSTPAYAHSRGASVSEAPRGQSLVSGHKRSLSEKLKRLIIPTLPLKPERDREISGPASNQVNVCEDTTNASPRPPFNHTAPKVSEPTSTAYGNRSDIFNANENSQPRGKVSTDHLHLQVDVRVPDRPYRSPGTASFMVRRDWPDHASQEADARDHAAFGRKISASAEAQAYVAVQQQKRRKSDEAIRRYEAAIRGLEEDEYEFGYPDEEEEGAGDYAKRASDATFGPGTSRGLLAPNATNLRGSCKDEKLDEGDGVGYVLQEQDESDECASRASTRVAELIENLLGDKPPSVSESEAYTSSDDSFGTSPVTRLGNDLHCDVVLN